MDVAKALVRSVARAFYDVKHVLVIDALMIHNAFVSPPPNPIPNLQLTFPTTASETTTWATFSAFKQRTSRNYAESSRRTGCYMCKCALTSSLRGGG